MTLRDADRFKDKIEVSLDSRQIFFLFFGGAVVACLVFVLGVMVGRRLEEREQVAHRATTSAAVDPLAALDELAADEDADDLAFHTALAGNPGERDRPLGAADVAKPTPPPPAAPPPAANKPPEKKPDAKPPESPKPPEAAPANAKSPEAPAADAKPKPDEPKKKRYTLQLSSFQDRGEADAFVAKLKGAGYNPYVVQSDVPDRGTFYRVRIGEYDSHDAALAAKSEFERRQHIIAYVTKL